MGVRPAGEIKALRAKIAHSRCALKFLLKLFLCELLRKGVAKHHNSRRSNRFNRLFAITLTLCISLLKNLENLCNPWEFICVGVLQQPLQRVLHLTQITMN